MIGHRYLPRPSAAVVGIVWGLFGCTSSVTVLDRRYDDTLVAVGTGIRDQPVLSAPAPSVGTARRLASTSDPDLEPADNAGWRVGLIHVRGDVADWLEEHGKARQLVALGYHFEILRGRYEDANGVVQIVPMMVGMAQSWIIPSVNILVGVRHVGGWEVACGIHYMPRFDQPEATGLPGLGFVASIGYTFTGVTTPRSNIDPRRLYICEMRIPINFAVGFAADATVYSVTIGCNTKEW